MPHIVRIVALCGLIVLMAGCSRPNDRRPAASILFGADPGASSASKAAVSTNSVEPRTALLEGSPILVEYELRQQVDLTPASIGQYYQRFVDAAGVMQGFGWQVGIARTYVRRTGAGVPPTVTVQIDRFATSEGAARFLDSLRRNDSPSLSHFLDLTNPAGRVDQPVTGDEAAAFEGGLSDRGITPQIVPVRYYAFRRGSVIGQIIVVRDGPLWPDILTLARAQDDRLIGLGA